MEALLDTTLLFIVDGLDTWQDWQRYYEGNSACHDKGSLLIHI